MPRCAAVRTTARMAGFMPPASPPLVSTAMLESPVAVSVITEVKDPGPVRSPNPTVPTDGTSPTSQARPRVGGAKAPAVATAYDLLRRHPGDQYAVSVCLATLPCFAVALPLQTSSLQTSRQGGLASADMAPLHARPYAATPR